MPVGGSVMSLLPGGAHKNRIPEYDTQSHTQSHTETQVLLSSGDALKLMLEDVLGTR